MAAERHRSLLSTIAAALLLWGCGDSVSNAPAAYVPPVVTPPAADDTTPFLLSQTGLYIDIQSKQLAPDLIAFSPRFVLWSDGAQKQRWLRLPAGTTIDTSDMDHWQFPVGTIVFKEFAVDGKRIETRMIMRTGEADTDYFMGAFAWNDDESDALFVRDGQDNARDTPHDIPQARQCLTCHDGEAGRILGFSAVQQPDVDLELLSVPPDAPFEPPGDATTQAALGYLHANCGHCHNLHGTSWPDTDMDLRLNVADISVEQTAAYRTTVGVRMQSFNTSPLTLRITSGDPAQSGVHYRMSMRGPRIQMPPLATELVDDSGLALVDAWIESL